MVWPTLGSRTAKEQNRTEQNVYNRQSSIYYQFNASDAVCVTHYQAIWQLGLKFARICLQTKWIY